MGGLQRQATKILHNFLGPTSARPHHSIASMGISVPKFLSQPATVLDAPRFDDSGVSNSLYRNPFINMMAVPKRKVSPSRKGKRNGPKAYKPITVIAKCKICGRVKLPHLYCCSGEIKS